MRKKLLKLLRDVENDNGFENKYKELWEEYACDYFVEEYLDFPNYRFIIKKVNDDNVVKSRGVRIPFSDGGIKAELKRMESDGLVMISIQKGIGNANGTNGPDSENHVINTESIILTTKGKSKWRYFLHQVSENPFALAALIISLISLSVAILRK